MLASLLDSPATTVVRTGRVEFSRPLDLSASTQGPAARHTYRRPVVSPLPRRDADALAGRATW
jgi:hypothetical protein